MESHEKEINELKLLSDENFGLETFELPSEWIEEEQRRTTECQNLKFRLKKTKQLKSIARMGLSNSSRRRWWFFLSGGFDLYCRVGNIYEYAIENAKQVPIGPKSNFGISFNLLDFVPPKIASNLPTFLHALWYHNQEVEYSPLIPAISAMLLIYMEPSLAYLSLQSIINASKDSLFYLLLNKKQYCMQIEAIEKLISIRFPTVFNHARKLGIEPPQLILSIFPSFFIPFISLPVSLTLFDSFISEGRKVFYRFILQILQNEKYNLVNTTDSSEFNRLIFNAIDRINNPDVMKAFLKKAFQIKLKRKNHIEKLEKKSSAKPEENKPHVDFSKLHVMANKPSSLNVLFNHRRTKTFDAKFSKNLDLGNNIIKSNDSSSNIDENEININLKKDKNSSSSDFLNIKKRNNSTKGMQFNKNANPLDNSELFTDSNNSNYNEPVENAPNIDLNNNDATATLSNSNLLDENINESRVKIENYSDLNGMKNIQAMIAQRNLPAIYCDGESNLILNEKMLLSLRTQLSPIFLHYSASLAFKLSVHGSSFKTMFSRCNIPCQYIMVVKTENRTFGAFLSDCIQPQYKGRYVGTKLTFVYDFDKLAIFRVKNPVNRYFMSVSEDCLMIGGPDPAIYITNSFKKVYSNACETFNSPILTENESGDDIIDFEVYKFIPHHVIRQRRKSINSIQKNV